MSGGGFTVCSPALASGSSHVSSLGEECRATAAGVIEALGGMQASAGHPEVEHALAEAAAAATGAFLDAAVLYHHIAAGLAKCAQAYTDAEQANVDLLQQAGTTR